MHSAQPQTHIPGATDPAETKARLEVHLGKRQAGIARKTLGKENHEEDWPCQTLAPTIDPLHFRQGGQGTNMQMGQGMDRSRKSQTDPDTCANLAWDKGGIPGHWVNIDSLFDQDVGGTPHGWQTLVNEPNALQVNIVTARGRGKTQV